MTRAVERMTVWAVLLVLIGTLVVPAGAGGRASDVAVPAQPDHDYYMVQLADPPLASYTGGIRGIPRTKPDAGRKINLQWEGARRYQEYLAAKRQDYKRFLQSNAGRAAIVREYSVVFNGFAIKLNGENAQTLGQGPGAGAVSKSFLVKPAMNESTKLIKADTLWPLASGGSAYAGAGIKVGIIDTGIDLTNPFLSNSGYASASTVDACGPFSKPGGARVNNKVIVCRFFVSGLPAAAPFSPFSLLVFDHGTHVSGTVAGNYNTDGATVEGTTVQIDDLSGIAPHALLGDYNVFPGFGVGYVVYGGSAFSHDIAAALEAAVSDGMDVVNMSLGGTVQGPHDFLADVTNSTVDAGVVAAVAAGNSGPGDSTVESPGSAANAITAGASTNPHFLGQQVSGIHSSGTVGGAVGSFAAFPDPAVTWSWQSFGSNLACAASVPAPTTDPQIAVISRGSCTFSTKIRNAQNAGYDAVVIRNNVAGDPIAMGQDGTANQPTIPAVMIQFGAITGTSGTGTVGGPLSEFVSTNSDIIAGFSSRGPNPFTYLIKPDVTAPGVNVLSSVFNGKFAFFQGTSMATPHVAGSAALLKFLHSGWSPDDIKSALVNTAKREVFSSSNGTTPVGVLARGGGRIDLAAANATPLTLSPASVSFGYWNGNKAVHATVAVSVKNVSGVTQACTVDVTGSAVGVTTSSTLNVSSNGSATLPVTINAGNANQTGSGDYSGDIEVNCSTTLKIPWFVRIDREAKP